MTFHATLGLLLHAADNVFLAAQMFGKQIYKGSMERTVLGKSDGDAGSFQKRYYDKEELTKLFELDPAGKCESLERFQQSDDGAWTKKCSTSKEHNSVVGISRRSVIYKDKANKRDVSHSCSSKSLMETCHR